MINSLKKTKKMKPKDATQDSSLAYSFIKTVFVAHQQFNKNLKIKIVLISSWDIWKHAFGALTIV